MADRSIQLREDEISKHNIFDIELVNIIFFHISEGHPTDPGHRQEKEVSAIFSTGLPANLLETLQTSPLGVEMEPLPFLSRDPKS